MLSTILAWIKGYKEVKNYDEYKPFEPEAFGLMPNIDFKIYISETPIPDVLASENC